MSRRANIITPSYAQGFARSAGESANPGLWDGLVGAWMPSLGPSGGTLYDISSRKSHGTLNGSLNTTGWVPGSMYFDGNDDYVDCGVSPAGGLSAITVSAWVKVYNANTYVIAQNGTDYTRNSFYLVLNAGKPEFEIYTTGYDVFTATSALPTNVFSHLCGVWKTGQYLELYVNGRLSAGTQGGTLQTNPLKVGDTNLLIGGRPAAPLVLDFRGNVASFTIHNRVLSPSEIKRLYEDPLALVRRRARVFSVAAAAAPSTINGYVFKFGTSSARITGRRQVLHTPSYAQGFARSAGESAKPGLWRGLVGAWMPSLGASGGTLFDISGRKNHGTLTNMDPATDWVPTEKGMALKFDGISKFVDCGDIFDSETFLRGSVSFWVKSAGDVNFSRLISMNETATSNRIIVYNSGTTLFGYIGSSTVASASSFLSDAWQHTVFTWDNENGLYELYKDGVAQNADTGSNQSLTPTTRRVRIGIHFDGVSVPFKGQMSFVSVHRRLLSPQEIQHLYADPMALVRRKEYITSVFIPSIPVPDPEPDLSTSLSRYYSKTWTQKKIFDGIAVGDTELAPIQLGATCPGVSVCVKGSGTCNIKFSADQGNAFWVTPPDGVITGAANGKIYSNNDAHAWMSVEVEDGSTMEIWVYRKINLNQ